MTLARGLLICGAFFVAAAVVLRLMAYGGMTSSMPTQVPPPRIARATLVAGTVFLALGVAASLF